MGNDDYSKSLMYSVIINSTIIDSKCVNELVDNNLIESYKDIYEVVRNGVDLKGLSERTVIRIKDASSELDKIRKTYDRYEELIMHNRIKVVSDDSEYYPRIWAGLTGMPKVFYIRGNADVLKKIDECGSVSVVGSRKPSRYAQCATNEFVKPIASGGAVIVSGMALGIDRTAHEAAMDAQGTTLAVMPGGCDEIYPRENTDVFERILSGGGAVLSEMPPSSGIKKQYFPSRNRLISALSDCCLIMEAGEYSGTLHTASYAACQGREVFVLPNNIYADNCMGGLRLINDGASILLSVDDVIDSVASMLLYRKVESKGQIVPAEDRMTIRAIRQKLSSSPADTDDNDIKLIILDELSVRNRTCDELCDMTGLPFYRIAGILSDMELDGKICQDKGKFALTISH